MKAALAALLLGSHLVCMNLAAGGPLLAARLDWLAHRRRDADALAAVRWLAYASLVALFLGAILGLTVAWVRWSPSYRTLWMGPLRDKLFWATWEFLFSLLLFAGWCWWLPRRLDTRSWPVVARGVTAALAATNLLYHFPFLFGVARRLAERLVDDGLPSGEPLPRSVFRSFMLQHELPALAVHVALASVAVAGGGLLVLAWSRLRKQQTKEAQALATLGGRWALVASLAQFPVGLWLLVTLPTSAQSQVLGENTAATLLFVASLGFAVVLVFQLAHLLASPPTPRLLVVIAATLVATILLMSAAHDQARITNGIPRLAMSGQDSGKR